MKHKSFSQALLPGLLALSILAACGSDSGDGGYGYGGWSPLPAGVVTRTVDLGTAAAGNVIPFRNTVYDRAQYLYTSAQVRGSGRITALRFRRSATVATDTSCPGLTMRLGHTNLAALTTTFAGNFNTGQGSLVTVINNATFIVPAGAAGAWIEIPLQAPFDYNGVHNLLVEFERTIACSQNVAVDTQTAANMRVFTPTAGSATGTVDGLRNMAQFVFAGGETRIDLGGASSNFFPFADTALGGNEGPRIQNLYLASEINGSGPITGIAFQLNAISPGGSYTYTLKLGHSTLSALGATFASNYSTSPATVANAVTFTIPASIPAGEWAWVPIPDGTFTYNGTDNLIVEVATSAGTADTRFRVASIAGRRVWANDTTGTAVTGNIDVTAYHLMLRFNGGPVSVITDGGAATGLAFSTTTAGRLNLYRAAELGSAGTITSVGCRMQNSTSSAASYANYQVIIGHSSLDSLVAASASNFVSQAIAVNGPVSVPAGLVSGDWIELPLSTPFAYDGKSNLSVWMGTAAVSGAAGIHSCLVSTSNASRYPGQMAMGAPGAATVGPQDFKFDMKLNISR